jgi:hypothetical protein
MVRKCTDGAGPRQAPCRALAGTLQPTARIRFLVALALNRDLLLRAKHLFVAAIMHCPECRQPQL